MRKRCPFVSVCTPGMAGIVLLGLSVSPAQSTPTKEPTDSTSRYFLVDGMAVDQLKPEPETPAHFKPHIPSLAEGGKPFSRRRLMDAPEPLRDPVAQRQVLNHQRRASQFAQRGEFETALLELRDALAMDPVNPTLLRQGALYSTNLRDFERAAGFYRRLIEVQPDDPEVLTQYAAILLRLARFDEAEHFLSQAEPSLPNHLVVQFSRLCLDILKNKPDLSKAYWRSCMIDQIAQLITWLQVDREVLQWMVGAEDFQRLCDIALGSGTADKLDTIHAAYQAFAQAQRVGDGDAALAYVQELKSLGVHSLGLDAARATVLLQQNEIDAAMELWNSTLARKPDWADGWFNYGFALFRAERFEEAQEALRKATELDDSPVIHFILAAALSMGGSHDEAQIIFTQLALDYPAEVRKWLELDPRLPQALQRMRNSANLFRRIGIPPELQ